MGGQGPSAHNDGAATIELPVITARVGTDGTEDIEDIDYRVVANTQTTQRGSRRSHRDWVVLLVLDLVALVPLALSNPTYARGLMVSAALTILLLAAGGLYRPRFHLSVLDELPALTGRFLVAAWAVVLLAAVRHQSFDGFDTLFRSEALMLLLLLGGRAVSMWGIRLVRRRRLSTSRALLLGGGQVAAELTQVLARHPRYGLEVVGYVDDPDRADPVYVAAPRLGDLSGFAETITAAQADLVIVADPDTTEARFNELIREAVGVGRDLVVVPRMHQFHIPSAHPDHIGAIPVVRLRTLRMSGWRWLVKRGIDVAVSALAIVALGPVLVACAIAVRIEGGPGILFRQQRVGRDGRHFEVLKFRSLRPLDEAESRTTWSIAHDHRVGRVGRFLRRTSLDELPQLWNILRGDMTLVGPRPERPHFVEVFSAEHSLYAHRHRVPAGLTGLAQVSGLRGDTPISERARFDNFYIENWSLWLDLKIVLRTIREVIFAGGR